MLEHGGNVDVALSLAQIARRRLPELPNVADTLGWAYYHKATYGLAIDLLEEAVKKGASRRHLPLPLGARLSKNKRQDARENAFTMGPADRPQLQPCD